MYNTTTCILATDYLQHINIVYASERPIAHQNILLGHMHTVEKLLNMKLTFIRR